jgi:predicted alpha/beta-hydrolase family hydrolase
MEPPELLFDGPVDARWTVVLAHGAGAPMDSPFMAFFAAGLAGAGHRVARFEFPYMAGRRTGKRRPPDRTETLMATWRGVIERLADGAAPDALTGLVIGGKSLGGRIASMVVDAAPVEGLICLGYPFHPPGRPEAVRIAHLRDLRTPALIVQGERDSFGRPSEVAGYRLSSAIRVCWLADGDHGFRPRVRSGRTLEHNLDQALALARMFLDQLSERPAASRGVPGSRNRNEG